MLMIFRITHLCRRGVEDFLRESLLARESQILSRFDDMDRMWPTPHRIGVRIIGAHHPALFAVAFDQNSEQRFGRPDREIQPVQVIERFLLGPAT